MTLGAPLKQQRYPLRRPINLADWGYGVSVCIAAECGHRDVIATATDMQLDLPDIAGHDAQLTAKGRMLAKRWVGMFAGDDISHASVVLAETAVKFNGRDANTSEVKTALRHAYRAEYQRMAEDRFLTPYGLSFKEFQTDGQNLMTDTAYEEARRDIQGLRLGCDFLVAGFSKDDDMPHIFALMEKSERAIFGIENFDTAGFWAIGSGANNALVSLSGRGFHSMTSAQAGAYAVAEAKFVAERVRSVGKNITMLMLHKDGNISLIFGDDTKRFREAWEKEAVLPLPANIDTRDDFAIAWRPGVVPIAPRSRPRTKRGQ